MAYMFSGVDVLTKGVKKRYMSRNSYGLEVETRCSLDWLVGEGDVGSECDSVLYTLSLISVDVLRSETESYVFALYLVIQVYFRLYMMRW